MVKRVIFGEVANDHVAALHGLERARVLVLGVLAVAVLVVGVWPAPLHRRDARRSVDRPARSTIAASQAAETDARHARPSTSHRRCPRSSCSVGDLRRSCSSTCSCRDAAPTSRYVLTHARAARGARGRHAAHVGTVSARHAFDGMFVSRSDRRRAEAVRLRHRRASRCSTRASYLRGARAVPRRVLRAGAVRAARHDGDDLRRTACSRCTSASSCCRCRCTRWSRCNRDSASRAEAAMKYFVLGALASGMLLYGMSMIYGATGTLDARRRVARALSARPANRTLLLFGLVFIVVRRRVQVRRGAVPHVGAGRLPRRADGRDAVHRHGARSSPRSRSRCACSSMALRRRCAIDWQDMLIVLAVLSMVARQRHRDRADQPQAHARVLDDRQHGLHAAGLPRRHDRNGYSAAMFYTFAYVLMTLGVLRHDHAAVARGLRGRPARRLQGPEPAHPVVRVHDADGDVLAGRRAADRRLLREARGARRRAVDAGFVWLAVVARAVVADRRVLLPAHRQAHVLRRAGRDASPIDRARRHARAAVGQRPRAAGASASCRSR